MIINDSPVGVDVILLGSRFTSSSAVIDPCRQWNVTLAWHYPGFTVMFELNKITGDKIPTWKFNIILQHTLNLLSLYSHVCLLVKWASSPLCELVTLPAGSSCESTATSVRGRSNLPLSSHYVWEAGLLKNTNLADEVNQWNTLQAKTNSREHEHWDSHNFLTKGSYWPIIKQSV